MENMKIYEKMRNVPASAIKPITAGRLKGFSDINPMWRIKTLTETFGACGIGWYSTIDKQWIESAGSGEITAFCNISLYINYNGEWSKPICGTGGSKLAAEERSGIYVSDECFKMAYTDALSVAAKMLGCAADIYYQNDRSKYTTAPDVTKEKLTKEQEDLIKVMELHIETLAEAQNVSKQKVIDSLRSKLNIKFNSLDELDIKALNAAGKILNNWIELMNN